MSFSFQWPRFSDQFHADAIQMLNNALNKGNKPPVIADKIEVVELEMGTEPPELEIRDIGDLTIDQFRGIFRLTYSGNAHIVLKTKVQANPLNHKQPDIHLMTGSRGMLAAKQPLVVPMLLRLSHFKLSSYVVLVVSKQKGITLVFKTDPLQNVDINSTFDSIAVIQKFIQKEIEGQLRQMFKEDLPGIIHRLSQQWVKAKVEAPYLNKRPPSRMQAFDAMSASDMSSHPPRVSNVGFQSYLAHQHSHPPFGYNRPRSSSSHSIATTSRRTSVSAKSAPPSQSTQQTTLPDLEIFDPTYGLRPEGIPNKSLFSAFGSLFTPDKGLADLAETEEDEYEEEFSVVDWEDTFPDFTSPQSVNGGSDAEDRRDEGPAYETAPAVGGGTILRPRVYHSQSLIQPTSSNSTTTSTAHPWNRRGHSPPHSESIARLSTWQSHSSSMSESKLSGPPPVPVYGRSRSVGGIAELEEFHRKPLLQEDSPLSRAQSPDSLETQASESRSTRSLPTPLSVNVLPHQSAIYIKRPQASRRSSTSQSNFDQSFQSSTSRNSPPKPDPEIVLRPSSNNSVHQLSTLSHSNHTLSPYTRSLEHFTVRSVPPRGPMAVVDRQPVRARRKRIHRLRQLIPPGKADTDLQPPASPRPPSEFDASDMDRYFRSRDSFD